MNPESTVSALQQKRPKVRHLSLRLPFDIHDELVKAAEEHERSLSGEIRWVLRRYADDPAIFEER